MYIYIRNIYIICIVYYIIFYGIYMESVFGARDENVHSPLRRIYISYVSNSYMLQYSILQKRDIDQARVN